MTETLIEWGIEPVACTRFCEQPDLRHVGGTKDPDLGAIRALAPDLVIVDAEENRREDHDALVAAGVEVVALRIRAVADVAQQLEPLAERLGVRWTMTPPAAPRQVTRRAFVPIWKRPWMALGAPTYGSSVLAHVGLGNVCASDADPYPRTDLEDARRRGPDVVIAPDEPYRFGERHRSELESVAPAVFVDGKDLFWWGVRTPAAVSRLAAATAGHRRS